MTLTSPKSIHGIRPRALRSPTSIHGAFTLGPEVPLCMVAGVPEVPLSLVSRQEALRSPTSRLIHDNIVHFKRLGSRGFQDLVNHYLCFFSNISLKFLKQIFLMIFMNIKCQRDSIMGKPLAHLWGRHDLHKTDRESVLKRTAIAYVVHSNQPGIKVI